MLAKLQKETADSVRYQLIKLSWNQFQAGPESLDEKMLEKLNGQAQAAEKLISLVLQSPDAKKHKVRKEELDLVIDTLKSQFDNLKSFKLSLKQQGLTELQLRQAIYQDLLCEKIIEAQSCDYTRVTEAEAIDYYQKNVESFTHPERRKVSHILITINEDFPENKRGAVMLKMSELRAQLLNNISQFPAMALSSSECPSALNEGLIGTVTRGQLYPELDKVLFLMQAETISSIVESEVGLHLLLCHEIISAGRQSQQDAVPVISEQINAHRRKKREKKYLSSLLQTA